MAIVVNMPRLSDTMEEGTVASWLKNVGDFVEEGDILAEIETDKATMEFESFNEGTLLHVGLSVGDSAKVDDLLAIIGPKGKDISRYLNVTTKKVEVTKENVVTESKPEVKIIDGKKSFIPIKVNNILLNSMGFVLDDDKAAMWRGPMLSGAIKQLKELTQWGDLDYLFIDMPPGTGDAYLTVAAEIKPDHVLLVTSQSNLAVQDTIKSKAMFDRLKIPMIGIIDNMSYSLSPNSDKKIDEFTPINLEDEIGLKVLGSVPRTREIGNFNPEKSSIVFEPIYNEILKIIQ